MRPIACDPYMSEAEHLHWEAKVGELERARACVNAMARIADPSAFVAKVRELIAAARVLEGAELDMGLIRDDTGDIEELNAEATNVCEIARDLAALLHAE